MQFGTKKYCRSGMYTNWPVLAEFYALRVHIVFTYFYLLTEFGDSVLIVFSYRTERQRDRHTQAADPKIPAADASLRTSQSEHRRARVPRCLKKVAAARWVAWLPAFRSIWQTTTCLWVIAIYRQCLQPFFSLSNASPVVQVFVAAFRCRLCMLQMHLHNCPSQERLYIIKRAA